MLAALRQRGPDAEHARFWTRGAAADRRRAAPNALLHTRLSIIDPRPEADQPMGNDAGRRLDLVQRRGLRLGRRRRDARRPPGYASARAPTPSSSCTRTSTGASTSSRGCAACSRSRSSICGGARVYVVRDRLGLKPVVYAHRDDGFAFASTVRALLPWLPRDARALLRRRHRRLSRAPDDSRAAHDLRRRSRGCRRRTGCATTSRRGTLETREYWRPEPSAEPWLPTLDAAIRMRTVADRPLGLFLSSGVDSSAIACRLAAMGFNRLQSFTAAFPGHVVRRERRRRAPTAERLGFPNLAIDDSRAASPTISRASSPTSTSRSPIRRACRRGISRARRRGT